MIFNFTTEALTSTKWRGSGQILQLFCVAFLDFREDCHFAQNNFGNRSPGKEKNSPVWALLGKDRDFWKTKTASGDLCYYFSPLILDDKHCQFLGVIRAPHRVDNTTWNEMKHFSTSMWSLWRKKNGLDFELPRCTKVGCLFGFF